MAPRLPLLLAQPYPETSTLDTLRLRGGEAGLPDIFGSVYFGHSVAASNGLVAVGTPYTAGQAGVSRGSVWVISMRANGSAAWYREIGDASQPSEMVHLVQGQEVVHVGLHNVQADISPIGK